MRLLVALCVNLLGLSAATIYERYEDLPNIDYDYVVVGGAFLYVSDYESTQSPLKPEPLAMYLPIDSPKTIRRVFL